LAGVVTVGTPSPSESVSATPQPQALGPVLAASLGGHRPGGNRQPDRAVAIAVGAGVQLSLVPSLSASVAPPVGAVVGGKCAPLLLVNTAGPEGR
jgi:hypothetical protein